MDNSEDEKYMRRCLELAKLGLGTAAPNPLVGSVIVYQGKIIGEGYHQKCGEAHAEVNAINSVKNPELLEKATLYVNLEPCAHHGRTPPCSDLIVRKKIPRVVIGCVDSFAKVAGKGIEKLKAGGCNVTVGILEEESRWLNRRFFTFHEKKRPYIILKWAETKDGFIDKKRKSDETVEQNWITNQISKKLVHKWRTEEAAFMVGRKTVKKDNPQLTVRDWVGRNPVRIVFDQKLKLAPDLKIFDNQAKTIIFNAKKESLENNLHYLKINYEKQVLPQVLQRLYELEIQSIVVEGGEKLLTGFIEADLWDEARIFIGNKYFKEGVKAPEFHFIPDEEIWLEDTLLKIYYH
ncbi:MAG: bifunctional diaminohydroxyphosphoribosylaminopyrimidine deaminase/5-amino-6-(5-phosphoribosylamino)uracil reductase RibD [Bacteroidales bacterium]|nr:bifunctional diaminohydroxyphosphoribosylaminopyrimidine deaminase/5-amino-6-(5-phosphoribosylamino)uracil reductase RibD [Bacteroidales bacterium]